MASLLTKSLPLPGSRLAPNDMGELDGNHHILICLLGDFRVLKAGQPIRIAGGSKAETLLCSLALRQEYGALRDVLLATLWPNTESTLAAQSLNSLVYDLHKRLGDGISRCPLIRYADGAYRLNVEAGVGIDVKVFDSLAAAGRKSALAGNHSSAVAFYTRALKFYRGDLHAGTDVHAIMERERLRALYLTALAYVADFYYAQGDYAACLDHSLALLASDPFREDAHRLVMRCYVRRGERAQALHQYRVCEEILRAEFDAAPEASTRALYDLIRLDPSRV
jgi:DNA-binding SARP family transcriptional activator